MTVTVTFKAVRPPKMKIKQFKRILNKTVKTYADVTLRKEFDATQSTFKGKFPIIIKDESGRNRIAWSCIVNGKIYFFISEGTSVRYATMSPDWRSKTRPSPGGLKAGAGRGRKLFVNRSRPRPGIKARKFDERIARKLGKATFQRALALAMVEGADGVWK